MAVEYRIICDDCGVIVGTSMTSARAARADAALNHGGNSGMGRDHCKVCRIAASQATASTPAKSHSTPPMITSPRD